MADKTLAKAETKPRNYKLSPAQLTEQVIALDTKDMKEAQKVIAEIEGK